jgi:predicted RNA-binding Zn ribbon-like protein
MAKPARWNPSYELSLDFSNTVDWRNSQNKRDGIESFSHLVSWSVKKGIIPSEEAAPLLRAAREQHAEEGALRRAIQLRETIYKIFSAIAHDEHPDEEDVGALNKFLSDYPASSAVVRNGEGYGWRWVPGRGAEGMILWSIAKSAADLLTSDQLGRVTECANEEEGCGWVFLDKTRSRTRKWCSMDGCGNRAKARTWYEKHEKAHGTD